MATPYLDDLITQFKEISEPQEGDFDAFKSEYQCRRINRLMDALQYAADIIERLKPKDPPT